MSIAIHRKSKAKLTSLVLAWVCFMGAGFMALPVLADPLGAGEGTVFRLDAESSFEMGCFDPCLCPLAYIGDVKGTMKLVYTGSDGVVETYRVEDVNWYVAGANGPVHVAGGGRYQWGSPNGITVIEHRLELDLTVGEEPVAHFDSGWTPVTQIDTLNTTISINGIYCWDVVFHISSSPVPDHEISRYTLTEGSTFQRGCWDPCDCLLGPEVPMTGTFALVPLQNSTKQGEYAIVDVDWSVGSDEAASASPIVGVGTYRNEPDIQRQQMGLELVVGEEPRTHYDSGDVPVGAPFPLINAVVSINGIVCFDTVLHVVAQPIDAQLCGGIAGLPCDDGEFCKYPIGACCCDYMGVCMPTPMGCPEVWDPVCGCDGETYGNECEADKVGAPIHHWGECRQPCGGNGETCGEAEFCKYPTGQCVDITNAGGHCQSVPNACYEIYDPVCGCDGNTYSNDCFADMAAVSVLHEGPCDPPQCVATRRFANAEDLTFCVGDAVTVVINLNPPANASAIALEDAPPAGWTVVGVSHDGVYDASTGKVKWAPMFPPFPESVSYTAIPGVTENAAITHCFEGTVSVDGENQPICGAACLEVCCPRMAVEIPRAACPVCPVQDCSQCVADTCMDGQVGLCELIGYACAWLNGCNDDLSGMTRAAYIWRNGECYCWDKAESNWIPSDCALADSGCCEAAGSASNGTADGSARLQLERTKRNRQRSIIDVRASVIVDPPIGASAFSIEVEIPQGMAVETVSHGGRSDADCRVVRWGPFYGDEPLTVTFAGSRTLTSTRKNARNQPTDSFRGTISFDGVNQPLDVDE